MRLHYLNGDRTAALRQFERCRHALRTELGIEPAAPITLLYEQIRADRLEAAQSPVPSGHTPARREQAIAEGAEHTQLEASLVALQQQVSSTLRVLRNTRSADH
jgi:DNA-binding SARP family transcriptional activator